MNDKYFILPLSTIFTIIMITERWNNPQHITETYTNTILFFTAIGTLLLLGSIALSLLEIKKILTENKS